MPGDVEVVDGLVSAYGLEGQRQRDRRAGLRRPPGERFRRRRPDGRRRRRLPPGRRGAAGDRRHRVPPHLHLGARGQTCSRRSRERAHRRPAAPDPRRPPRGPVPRREAARDPSAVGAPRSRPGAARAAARRGARAIDDARARAPRRRRADRPPAPRAGSPSPAGTRDATAEQASRRSTAASATVTHLFNAMRPFRHRDPGLAGAALARDDVVVQIILDGVHLAEETADWSGSRPPGASRSSPTPSREPGWATATMCSAASRSRSATALPAGRTACSPAASLTMIEAVRNLHALGVPLAEALAAASSVPARIIGLPDARPARGRASPRTWSCSTTTSRSTASRRRRGACRCLSPLPGPRRRRRASFGDPRAAAGAARLLEHERDYARVAASARDARCDDRAHGRARLLRQRRLLRRLRLRPAAALDRPPRLDRADRRTTTRGSTSAARR